MYFMSCEELQKCEVFGNWWFIEHEDLWKWGGTPSSSLQGADCDSSKVIAEGYETAPCFLPGLWPCWHQRLSNISPTEGLPDRLEPFPWCMPSHNHACLTYLLLCLLGVLSFCETLPPLTLLLRWFILGRGESSSLRHTWMESPSQLWL